ncbi:MAG: glycoside hydrolase family 2 [Prevotella sp.]|nr:glycoside hydrolase family 2 [Prevotella sp.]
MKRRILFIMVFAICYLGIHAQAIDTQTHRQYLSGTGCDDMVEWDFFCTDGRNSGKWTKIGVPSCWELQGFGTYQYGMRFYGKATPEGIANEKGLYKYEFSLPKEWAGRQIFLVFEAAMTDLKATINGRKAGNGLHQGGFTRYTIDVSDRIFTGEKKNRLEVEVSKESANPQVNMAERRADYWNFGGIWRPVYIISKPTRNIHRVAIDAQMDGHFTADVYLNRATPGSCVCVDVIDTHGKKVGTSQPFSISSDYAKVDFSVKNPKLWNAEQPNLYTATFTLKDPEGKTLHVEQQKFGFRTIEYRHSYDGGEDDGVFINGQKVIFKGVNRHSFRPESGRTLSKEKNIEDVRLIKSMNMNAVRLSHYPADPDFLDACDSLGLYVECELPGWHQAHETIIGSKLVEEMVTRDVNHPSIIFWSNGNEGGFNYELEPFFTQLDPQRRVVLYPWANRNGFETKHYRSWGETADYMRQKEIFLPTEFLHGLYDGGHGAGLKDYWELMMQNERCAGGFLWDLMDQAVLRTDQNGILDCVGNFGADGIVGPHGEKEGSYYTIKEIWSPVQLRYGVPPNASKGKSIIEVRNAYNFTSLSDCKFTGKILSMPQYGKTEVSTIKEFTIPSPKVGPGGTSWLYDFDSNDNHIMKGDVLSITAANPYGEEIFNWSFPIIKEKATSSEDNLKGTGEITSETAEELTITAGKTSYRFSKKDGRLLQVKTTGHSYSLTNGPRFVAVRRSDRSHDGFYNHDDKEAFQKKTQYTEYSDQGKFVGFSFDSGILTARYLHGSLTNVRWTFHDDGCADIAVSTNFNGVVDLVGIAFDYPEQLVKGKHWVGRGPYRVWQNRMEGPQYGYWQTSYNDPIPGESWLYPEFKGYFADVHWMQIETTEGHIGIEPKDIWENPETNGYETNNDWMYLEKAELFGNELRYTRPFVGVYTPRDGRDHILYDLPQTGISLLKVIPAVRNKVNTTDLNGPSAQPHWEKGSNIYQARLWFE